MTFISRIETFLVAPRWLFVRIETDTGLVGYGLTGGNIQPVGIAEIVLREIAPLLAHPLVEFVGEIGDAEKSDFLGGAGKVDDLIGLARAETGRVEWYPIGRIVLAAGLSVAHGRTAQAGRELRSGRLLSTWSIRVGTQVTTP